MELLNNKSKDAGNKAMKIDLDNGKLYLGEYVIGLNQHEKVKPSVLDSILERLDKLEGKELVYDQDEAVRFIAHHFNTSKQYLDMGDNRDSTIRRVLELEEDYMRSIGIIED